MNEVICKNCGAVNEFRTQLKSNNLTAWCTSCDSFIKNIPHSTKVCFYFGKYKDIDLKEFTTPEMVSYLKWVKATDEVWEGLSDKVKAAVDNQIQNTK